MDVEAAKEMMRWYQEIGASEPVGDTTVNRYSSQQSPSSPTTSAAELSEKPSEAHSLLLRETAVVDPPVEYRKPDRKSLDVEAAVHEAHELASSTADLFALREALTSYDRSELKEGARNLVFSDGNEAAEVMIVGEAPGRNEDLEGKPFVGQAGQLLDRMFEAINLSRHATDGSSALYITNVVPWRPPGNRNPTPAEIRMFNPFVTRHIELIQPKLLILMGNISCMAILGQAGITKLRGHWHDFLDTPVMPMFHPAYHLRNPDSKSDAWRDLLAIQHRLREHQS